MSVLGDLDHRKPQQSRLLYKTACAHSSPSHVFCVSPPTILTDLPSSPVSCQPELWGVLNPRVQPRAGNPEVTGIPQVDYSTSQQQVTSMQAEVAYLIKTPITAKPVVCTYWFVHHLASLCRLYQQG